MKIILYNRLRLNMSYEQMFLMLGTHMPGVVSEMVAGYANPSADIFSKCLMDITTLGNMIRSDLDLLRYYECNETMSDDGEELPDNIEPTEYIDSSEIMNIVRAINMRSEPIEAANIVGYAADIEARLMELDSM